MFFNMFSFRMDHLQVLLSSGRWVLGLALVGVSLSSCGAEQLARDQGTQAVVIGIDGADWKVVDALAAEGRLPNLTRLRERGVSGEIETLPQIRLSPAIWTSVVTGKTPEKHGISWFLVDRPDGTRVPVRSHNRKVKALWNILAEHDRRPTVIGWWASYPAEDVENGIIVSDGLGVHGFGATARDGDDGRKAYPSRWYEDLRALVPPEQQITADYARRFIHVSAEEYYERMFTPARYRRPDPSNPVHLFQQYAVTAEGYTSIAEELLEEPYDLLLVYFEQVDSFSHLFMKYAPPKLPWVDQRPHELFRDVVSEWYEHQDELLGRLLAKIDLERTAVFVLSDHGFKSGGRRIRSEQIIDPRRAHLEHETHGIFIAAGPHLAQGQRIEGASVLDITPTLLHYLGFPIAQDMDGKVLESLFSSSFLDEHPIRYIPSFENGGESETPLETDAEAADEALTADNMRALRSLGYVGGGAAVGTSGERRAAPSDDEASSAEIHNNLGRVYLSKGQSDEALREFGEALEIDPDNAESLLNMSALHRARGRAPLAEKLVLRALKVDPNSVGALAELALIKRDLGELDEAIRLFREALRVDDSQPFTYMRLGDALQRAGHFEEAERAFRRVLELNPDSHQAYYNLGATYGAQGRLDEAIENYEKSLELAPESPEAVLTHNNLGAIYRERGSVERAREHFLAAVNGSPAHLESRYNLAMLYLQDSKLGEAVALLEEAASIHPNHELVTLQLADAYARMGRLQDAYKSFLLVRRLYPDNWMAMLGLALLEASAGREEEARALVEEALRIGGEDARKHASGFPPLRQLMASQ